MEQNQTIHPIITKILERRGITEEVDVLEFLSEKPKRTYDPFLLKDMEPAVELISSAIETGKSIWIYGDYDADGVTATSLLLEILGGLTKRLAYYIPSRFDEGYGLNKDAIRKMKERGADLIITVDCGSTSWEEAELAKKLGIELIVTDHHSITDKPADCLLINPKQELCKYPFKDLAGCGVAFKLAQALQRRMGYSRQLLNGTLDLVALATIGDIVPLLDENRSLVKYGMKTINQGRRPGLKSLIQAAGLTAGSITSENVAYVLVPHLNAAGRMLSAKAGVELLTERDPEKIAEVTGLLVQNNKERKRVQEETFLTCKEIVERQHRDDLFLIVDGGDAHEGITGIVAGKLKEEYHRPTVIVTNSGEGVLKGTGRSVAGINLFLLLKEYEQLFLKFGGHAGACGFSMELNNLDLLRERLLADTKRIFEETPEVFQEDLEADCELEGDEASMKLASALECLAPFGQKNEKPLFLLRKMKLASVAFLGEDRRHVRFVAESDEKAVLSCILFQHAKQYERQLVQGNTVDLLGGLDINVWNGARKVQFVVKEIR